MVKKPEYPSEISSFYRNNVKKPQIEEHIREYTRENFYYQIINQALRRLRSPVDSYFLRRPFQDLFFSILETYLSQRNDDFRKANFSCFRGCKMPREEFELLKQNKDGYLQMEGFTSTSLSLLKAVGFMTNTLVEIRVDTENLGGDIDWGFASVEAMSSLGEEKEVLFNPINIFKVVECEEKHLISIPERNTSMKVSQFVVLEYAPLAGLMKRSREGGGTTDKESKMIINYEYQRRSWMERGFVGQGHALYECGHYEQALEWCEKGLNFLARKKRQLPQKALKEQMLFIHELMHWCVEALPQPRELKSTKQLQLREKNVELAK